MQLVCIHRPLILINADFSVLAQYLFELAESDYTDWKLKGVAVASYTVAVLGLFFFDEIYNQC